MARTAKTSDLLPPYVSYASWLRLLEALGSSLPPAVDETYLGRLGFSESNTRGLRSALRFLGLVGIDDGPTERLGRLAQAVREGGRALADALREMVFQAYRPLFAADLSLRSASMPQLRLYFGTMGARGQIQQKCSSFFLNLARDAGLQLPAPLVSRARPAPGERRTGAPAEPKAAERPPSPATVERREWALASSGELGLLLGMFPKFDIDWPEEKKQRWFRDFAKLIRISEREAEPWGG